MTPYPWTIEAVLKATGGALHAGRRDATFGGIAIDSRTIAPDELFVAIAGDTHDGHRFVDDVLDRGVKGVVAVSDKRGDLPMARMAQNGIACVCVTDTVQALGDLARFNRQRGPLTVAAVTGSNGKTSTRLLTEGVVAQRFSVLATRGNLNNHIGLPLTLLRLAPEHQAAVLELGMNHAGEIAYLGDICRPDIGVITNVAPAHLEGLGSIENVARAKGELLTAIRPGGTAVLNADDPLVRALADGLARPVLFFGTAAEAAVRAEAVRRSGEGVAFTLITPGGRAEVILATPARVMVANALAAAAVGHLMDIAVEEIARGLADFTPQAGRMGIRTPGRGIRLLDDTYNANPASMAAAIETLGRMGAGRRTLAVLGDMLELGEQSAALHQSIGERVAAAGIDQLYAVGRFAAAMCDGAQSKGMAADRIFCGDKAAIEDLLRQHLRDGDLILVKGSRGMAMETFVAAICQWAEA